LLIDPDATRLQGHGFQYGRENSYGDEEGSQVQQKSVTEEEQCEEVEFIAQVQSVDGQECRTRDEGDEAGQFEERSQRQEGDES
jgi:hypothetical protein